MTSKSSASLAIGVTSASVASLSLAMIPPTITVPVTIRRAGLPAHVGQLAEPDGAGRAGDVDHLDVVDDAVGLERLLGFPGDQVPPAAGGGRRDRRRAGCGPNRREPVSDRAPDAGADDQCGDHPPDDHHPGPSGLGPVRWIGVLRRWWGGTRCGGCHRWPPTFDRVCWAGPAGGIGSESRGARRAAGVREREPPARGPTRSTGRPARSSRGTICRPATGAACRSRSSRRRVRLPGRRPRRPGRPPARPTRTVTRTSSPASVNSGTSCTASPPACAGAVRTTRSVSRRRASATAR